ncbi:cytochrome P450 [Mycena maculata]|uniref:Cytochrome P450 n=1 Tax=Mycena maculata TaxID=230809 RepID=A0AAD7KCW1_9AGAR|nr:cytochrome P450 [Mycena maculata]
MPSSSLQTAGLVLISCASYILFRSYVRCRKSRLPPGPRGFPIVGNFYGLPKTHGWLAFMEMSHKYNSDIISLNVMGGTVIVLNSAASVDALLEDKSAIYSDRYCTYHWPPFVGFGWNFGLMPYGAKWKSELSFRVFVQQFQPSEVLLHRPTELDAARILLQRLLESPTKFERHLRHMAGMVILSTAYGIDIEPENDPYIDISEKTQVSISRITKQGAYLVDHFPFLKYVPEFFPGASFKREAREWNKAVSAMLEVPYAFVKASLAAGTAKSSIASRALEEIKGAPDAEEQEIVLKDILGSRYCGADTTVSALSTFILAMTMYPDVQKKAQAAVDEVVGQDRLPDFNDNIPYVDAVVREVLRWRPPLNQVFHTHAVMQDDIYNGFHIPAGATVLGNSWHVLAILHDEAIFGPHTDEFIPERWLTKDGEINTGMRGPDAAFGFGRRGCPGKDMAQWSVWICVISILATFNIKKNMNEKGVPIQPSGEYTSRVSSYPVPHKCDIVPRSETARAMIRRAVHD